MLGLLAQSPGLLHLDLDLELRQPKICKLEMAILRNDEVFWFEIPMDDVEIMKMLDG